MANPTTAAGDNGVSGATATTTALRNSVARTAFGSGASAVFSETMNLRFAYHPVECDEPARAR